MPSKLIAKCKAIEAAIEAHCIRGGSGMHRKLEPMRRELVRILVRQDKPDALLSLRRSPLKSLTAEFKDRLFYLSCAFDVMARYDDFTKAKAARLANVPVSDVEYALNLLKSVGMRLSDVAAEADSPVRSIVDAYFEELEVKLDQRAVEDLLLAAAETYEVKWPGPGKRYTEAYGLCFGSCKQAKKKGSAYRDTIVHVSRITTQMRAAATANAVQPNSKTQEVHLAVGAKLFNHLELLGDYHTHPYKSLEALRAAKGWEYSPGDEAQILHWNKISRAEGHVPRFSIVVAVARGGKTGRSARPLAQNRVQLTIDDLYFIVAAYRIQANGEYDGGLHLSLPQVSDA